MPKKISVIDIPSQQVHDEEINRIHCDDENHDDSNDDVPSGSCSKDVPRKKNKLMELVNCPDCKKMMLVKTLKYNHQFTCRSKNPPKEQRHEEEEEVVHQEIQPQNTQVEKVHHRVPNYEVLHNMRLQHKMSKISNLFNQAI